MSPVEALVLRKGEGRTFPRETTHGSVTMKVATEALTLFETERAAGDTGGSGMHSHPGFDESYYVVSGEWEFVAGEVNVVAHPGTVVHLPRGIFHAFRSTGRVDGRLLGVAVPGGIQELFHEGASAETR